VEDQGKTRTESGAPLGTDTGALYSKEKGSDTSTGAETVKPPSGGKGRRGGLGVLPIGQSGGGDGLKKQ